MKKLYLIASLLLVSYCSIAQTPLLTKGETISYLDKKFKESIGHELINSNGNIGKITLAEVKESSKGITIVYEYNYKSKYTYEFNPRLISSISELTHISGSSLNELSINLSGAVCVFTKSIMNSSGYRDNTTTSASFAKIIFLKADSSNFGKISKALNHLRDLLKAEDDPFGNP